MNDNPYFKWKYPSDAIPDKYWKKLLSNVKLSAKGGAAGKGLKTLYKNQNVTLHLFQLNLMDLKTQWDAQDGRCYWLGGKMYMKDLFIPHSPFAPSVDRVDNNQGYIVGNFVLTSRFANRGRNVYNHIDFETKLKEFMETIDYDKRSD